MGLGSIPVWQNVRVWPLSPHDTLAQLYATSTAAGRQILWEKSNTSQEKHVWSTS